MLTAKAIYWGFKILKVILKPSTTTIPNPEGTGCNCDGIEDIIDMLL